VRRAALVLALVLSALVGARAAGAQTTPASPARVASSPRATRTPHVAAAAAQVRAVSVVSMTVGDVERSAAFYTGVLGFEKVSDVVVSGAAYDRLWGVPGLRARVMRLRIGRESIELTQYLTPEGRPFPPDYRSNVRWFQHVAIVVSDMEAAYDRVTAHGVQAVSSEPQVLPAANAAAAGIAAFYFRDPDGHHLELIHYPAGKGEARWHETGDRLFLGIDHTAIAVGDTAASLGFYRDRLGLTVVGESLNAGREQEQLTGVPGARVHVTGLRAPAGAPGVELLEYEAPSGEQLGRGETHSNDLAHWHVIVTVANVDAAARALREAGDPALGEPVSVSGAALGFSRAVLVRDPDGHALELVQP
jgi:catechol 2,3-dioxygenase-like lactoylglutathione lyase family enzyme